MSDTQWRTSTDGSSTGEPILEALHLSLGYSKNTVLRDVKMEIRDGEFWFLLGTNGQGKTTLLAALMGTLRPQEGTIRRRGDFADYRRIGFVPQHCGLNPTLPTTVREFVLSGLVGIRADRAQRRGRLRKALEKLGLEERALASFWSLSGGQQQRALVARALIREPGVLIADEPTRGLDVSVENSLLQTLSHLNRSEGLTLIVVTHDLEVAARYGTHAALVHAGHVNAGTARDILTPKNFRRIYGTELDLDLTRRRTPSNQQADD